MIVPLLGYLFVVILTISGWLVFLSHKSRHRADDMSTLTKLENVSVCDKEVSSRIVDPFNAMDGLPNCAGPTQLVVEFFVTYGYRHRDDWRLTSRCPVSKHFYDNVEIGQIVKNPFYSSGEA